MVANAVELLILDFAGVCTPSVSARISAGGRAASEISVRDGCEELVRSAQRSGVVVVILSNEISLDWIDTMPLLGIVDHVVACSDNKIFKPDRRAFQRCLLLTGVDADHTLVVDDESDNIAVADSLGMHTVLFDEADPARSWTQVADELSKPKRGLEP